MKEKGVHEGCIEQVYGLFIECIYNTNAQLDEHGRWRMDGKELDEGIQKEVEQLWDIVTTENLNELSDYRGYQEEFLKLFGFGVAGVEYSADVTPEVDL